MVPDSYVDKKSENYALSDVDINIKIPENQYVIFAGMKISPQNICKPIKIYNCFHKSLNYLR